VPRLAGEAACELERVGVADGVDRGVDAAALGDLLGRPARVILGQVDRLGAERARHLQPLVDGVDRDHALSTRCERRLNGAEPDRAQPEDGDAVPGADARLGDRVIAGPHHIAREQGDLVGQPIGNEAQGEIGVGDEQEVRLRPLQGAEGLAVPEHATAIALVKVAAAAEEALAAGGAIGAEHTVSLPHAGHGVARRDDCADVLVADHEAGLDRHPPVVDVEIGSADAAGLHADDRVPWVDQLGFRTLVDADLARRLEGHRSHRRAV
jgi:hypothetical protein